MFMSHHTTSSQIHILASKVTQPHSLLLTSFAYNKKGHQGRFFLNRAGTYSWLCSPQVGAETQIRTFIHKAQLPSVAVTDFGFRISTCDMQILVTT